jgi:hypothetical protein
VAVGPTSGRTGRAQHALQIYMAPHGEKRAGRPHLVRIAHLGGFFVRCPDHGTHCLSWWAADEVGLDNDLDSIGILPTLPLPEDFVTS